MEYSILQRHIQLFDCGGTEAAIVIEAVAALEVFDRIDQRPAVGLSFGGKSSVRRQVAHESQETGQTGHAQVRLARFDWLRNGRKLFPIVSASQFDVARERLLGPAIAGKWRFHLVQDCSHVRSGYDSVA